MPFKNVNIPPLALAAPYTGLIPKFENASIFNELNFCGLEFNLWPKDSVFSNCDDRTDLRHFLRQSHHDQKMRRSCLAEPFRRPKNIRDIRDVDSDIFSQHSFGNKFEFFSIDSSRRLRPDSEQFLSNVDHQNSSIFTRENRLTNTGLSSQQDCLKLNKPYKVERWDPSDGLLAKSYNKNVSWPSSLSLLGDRSAMDNTPNPDPALSFRSDSDASIYARLLQIFQPPAVTTEEMSRLHELSVDISHKHEEYCRKGDDTLAKRRLANDRHITSNNHNNTYKSTPPSDKANEKTSQAKDDIVDTDRSEKHPCSTNSSVETIKKSKNHSVVAILGRLLSDESDQLISPDFSLEDVSPFRLNSESDGIKYESSDGYHDREFNMRHRMTGGTFGSTSCITGGVYGSPSVHHRTTGVWLAVSKDVLFNLMDRLLNGERGQLRENSREEHCGEKQMWAMGLSRTGGCDYPETSPSGSMMETWLQGRTNETKGSSLRSIRNSFRCQPQSNNDRAVRRTRDISKLKHLFLTDSHPSNTITRGDLIGDMNESNLSPSSEAPLELACRRIVPAKQVTSDITGTPVLRSLLDDDDVFMTSSTKNDEIHIDKMMPTAFGCKLKSDQMTCGGASSATIMTSSLSELLYHQKSEGGPERGERAIDHPGTSVVFVTRKRKLSECTCTDLDHDDVMLSPATAAAAELAAANKPPTDDGADNCIRLKSIKWKSSMLLRLRGEINTVTPGQSAPGGQTN